MKKTIIITLLSLFVALPVFAQEENERLPEQETPEMRAQKMTDKMVNDLNLDDRQREAMYEANLRKLKTEKDNTKVAPQMAEGYENDVKEILDDEQYLKYSKMQEEKLNNKPQKIDGSKSRENAPSRNEETMPAKKKID